MLFNRKKHKTGPVVMRAGKNCISLHSFPRLLAGNAIAQKPKKKTVSRTSPAMSMEDLMKHAG